MKANLKELFGSLPVSIQANERGMAYDACGIFFNGFKIQYRTAKITPKKVGQFVAIWTRGKDGKTRAYSESDGIDFLVIVTEFEKNKGVFLFPKQMLLYQGVFSSNEKQGKRGIRLYPIWDNPTSGQAINTQKWQKEYFYDLSCKKDRILFHQALRRKNE